MGRNINLSCRQFVDDLFKFGLKFGMGVGYDRYILNVKCDSHGVISKNNF